MGSAVFADPAARAILANQEAGLRLTQRTLNDLACGPGQKDRLVFDDAQKGLAVRVLASGAKNYLVQYTSAAGKRRIPLGSAGALTLSQARIAAGAMMAKVALGEDPAAERKAKAERDRLTLAAAVATWRELHLSNRRERYRSEAVRALRHAFGKAWDRPADALDRAAVVRSLDAIAKAGHGAIAARTAAYGRACFSWHAKRGAVASNPFATLPAFGPRVSRERVLSDLELAAVWHAAEAMPGSFGRIVQLLILTGARRSEVAGMLWSELDAELETWSIGRDRMKAGAAHVVPLSPQARTLLSEIDRGDGLVLPGDRPGRPVGGWSKGKAALDRATSVEGWTLHDLRRTVATGLQRLGVRLEVTEAVLGHTSGSRGGIVGVYQRHDWATEKRGALDAWGRHVEAIVNGEGATENVVKLAAR